MFFIKKFDLAIIGGGPIGLFTANYAKLHGLKIILFETLPELGGQPEQLYSFKKIYDIPAFNQISGSKLISNLKQNYNSEVSIQTNHCVESIEKKDDDFLIDQEFLVKSVILATGIGSFKPKKFPLKLNDEMQKHVHYYVKNPTQFSDQTIGIFGGGDSALDWALELAKTSKVKLIHRRNEFRGLESSVNKLKNLKNVEILTPFLPKEINLINNKLNVTLKKVGNSETQQELFSEIIVAYGFQANNNFAKKWGIELTENHIKVKTGMKTNIPGIYAVGDAVTYPGRVPVIGVGFGEAQIAVTAIMRNLFPEKTLTIHSTSI